MQREAGKTIHQFQLTRCESRSTLCPTVQGTTAGMLQPLAFHIGLGRVGVCPVCTRLPANCEKTRDSGPARLYWNSTSSSCEYCRPPSCLALPSHLRSNLQ
jgi:hypothetical protein